jgi:hypothetical protein
MQGNLKMAVILLHGLAWCPDSIPLAESLDYWASASMEARICE